MKMNFFDGILKWNSIPIFIFLLLFSCENQFVNEKEIQRQILQDEDFIGMMTEVFIMTIEDSNNDLNSADKEGYLDRINSNYDILNNRYNDLDSNIQKALADKNTSNYKSYAEALYRKISANLANTSSRAAVVYDGPSVCGRPDCGGSDATAIAYRKSIATACISGAYYSEFYCTTHNMGQCEAMRAATVQNCCDNHCPSPFNQD